MILILELSTEVRFQRQASQSWRPPITDTKSPNNDPDDKPFHESATRILETQYTHNHSERITYLKDSTSHKYPNGVS